MSKKIIWWGLGLIALLGIFIFALNQPAPKNINNQSNKTEPEIVRVGYREHGLYWPLFLGLEKGFFENENINVEKVPFTSTNQLMEALIAGQIDAALGGVNNTLLATLETKSPGEFKIFTISNETTEKYFSTVLVKIDSNITDITQLENKKVSTQPGSTTKFLFKKTVSDRIAPAEAQLEQMNVDLQLSSLESGQTDAAIVFEPTATIGVNTRIAKILEKALWSNNIMENCPVTASVLSKRFLSDKPEVAQKFVQAVENTIVYGENNEHEVQSAIAMYTPLTIDLAEQIPILNNQLLSEIDIPQLQSFFDLLFAEGEIKAKVNATDMLLPVYVESK